MPAIDVSFLLSDPDFAEPLVIYQRPQIVGDNGRAVITEVRVTPDPMGVILTKDSAIGGNEIERAPDTQYRAAALDAYSTYRFRSLSPDAQPDVVIFNGDRYVVTLINDYGHYGAGWVHAELVSMASVDNPP